MENHDDIHAHRDNLKDDTTKIDKRLAPKQLLEKTVDKTLLRAREAIQFANETRHEVRAILNQASDLTKEKLDKVTLKTKKSMSSIGQYSANTVREVVSETSEVAREVALHMAKTFLGNTPITLYLPELLLNTQIRKRTNPQDIDHISVQCGNDRFKILVDGHFRQFFYRLTLDFDVLECHMEQKKYLRLRQSNETLDLQRLHAGTLGSWATRKIGNIGFDILNHLPWFTLVNHLIRDIPGIQQEKHRYWYIDLEKAGFIDFINNPNWMMDKLISLSDFNILPGLNVLRESKELLRKLVEQFEISDLRVQSGRLEVQVKIS